MLNLLELELQVVVFGHVGTCNLDPGLLGEQAVVLAATSSSQI